MEAQSSILKLKSIIERSLPHFGQSQPGMYRFLQVVGQAFLEEGYILTKYSHEAMGHQIADIIILQSLLQKYSFDGRRPCIVLNPSRSANRELASEVSTSFFDLVHSECVDFCFCNLSTLPSCVLDLSAEIHQFQKGPYQLYPALDLYDFNGDLFDLRSNAEYNNSLREFSSYLAANEIEQGKYVCIHIRSSGFKSEIGQKEAYMLRNTPVSFLYPLADFLQDNKVKVVRIGGGHMPPMTHPNVVDQALSNIKFPYLDLLLCKFSLFNLLDNSGASFLSVLSRPQTFLYNLAPPMMLGWAPRDISIHQNLIWKDSQESLTYSEIFMPFGPAIDCSALSWDKIGVTSYINSSLEILELGILALKLNLYPLKNEKIYQHRLNKRLLSCIPNTAFNYGVRSSCPPSFLKKNELRFSKSRR